MRFKELVAGSRMALVASLPRNDPACARAALEAGADAVKVHVNVHHRASGNTFGDFDSNHDFIAGLIALAGAKPVGLVPGAAGKFISEAELRELEGLGLGFFSSYARDLPPFMMESRTLDKMVALDSSYDQATLAAFRRAPIDVVEASIIPGESYGQPLSYADLLRYADIAEKTGKPVLVPTQKRVRPSELRSLRSHGCAAIMIGAVVMGDCSPESIGRAVAEFRESIDAL